MTTTRKTPWLLILLLALVVVAASSGGTYLYFSQHGMAAEGSGRSSPWRKSPRRRG
ncbi:MAG: hypothetical protein LKM38_10100 [Pseudomonas veronii]|jgi:flagellar FliL protein|nr:hypothetical protein [Pseudomonas veronii]